MNSINLSLSQIRQLSSHPSHPSHPSPTTHSHPHSPNPNQYRLAYSATKYINTLNTQTNNNHTSYLPKTYPAIHKTSITSTHNPKPGRFHSKANRIQPQPHKQPVLPINRPLSNHNHSSPLNQSVTSIQPESITLYDDFTYQ
jgi:hypothetical protein